MSAKRERWVMPEDVANAISANDVQQEYDQRPPYQRNDYIGWINQAKRTETRQKRLNQMIDELKRGDIYMKMKWQPKPQKER